VVAPYSVSMTGEGPPMDQGDEVASADDLRASHERPSQGAPGPPDLPAVAAAASEALLRTGK